MADDTPYCGACLNEGVACRYPECIEEKKMAEDEASLVTMVPLLRALQSKRQDYIDIVFDGPPSHESGRFVEVEDANGNGINFGEWIQRPDGLWALRFTRADLP